MMTWLKSTLIFTGYLLMAAVAVGGLGGVSYAVAKRIAGVILTVL